MRFGKVAGMKAIKPFQNICLGIAALAMITGCHTTPSWYRGDGQIKNTSYFADGSIFCYTTEYTIRLASFDMSTNIQKEFNLGELSSFREPRITVCIRFKDQYLWSHFTAKEAKMLAKYGWRNLDNVKGSFGYRLSNQFGTLIDQPETILKNYNWGGGQSDSEFGWETEISSINHDHTEIPKGSKLKLWVSYTGDPSLTNRADFVVLWSWR
jgi:hypothetical protein